MMPNLDNTVLTYFEAGNDGLWNAKRIIASAVSSPTPFTDKRVFLKSLTPSFLKEFIPPFSTMVFAKAFILFAFILLRPTGLIFSARSSSLMDSIFSRLVKPCLLRFLSALTTVSHLLSWTRIALMISSSSVSTPFHHLGENGLQISQPAFLSSSLFSSKTLSRFLRIVYHLKNSMIRCTI